MVGSSEHMPASQQCALAGLLKLVIRISTKRLLQACKHSAPNDALRRQQGASGKLPAVASRPVAGRACSHLAPHVHTLAGNLLTPLASESEMCDCVGAGGTLAGGDA